MAHAQISRKKFLGTAAALGAAVTLGKNVWGADQEAANRDRPNLLLVFSDQQHWQALGINDPFFRTPHQDALAKESVVFDGCFCTTPQCSPSRSSLLTGFYPSKTGVMGNVGSTGGLPLDMTTVGKELQDAGYVTGYFGKWHLGDKATGSDGWDHHDFGGGGPDAGARAIDFLKTKRVADKPFALFVSFINPHDIYSFKKYVQKGKAEDVPLPESWERENFHNKPPIQKQFMTEDQGKAIDGQPREEWQKYRDCYRSKNELYDACVGDILAALKQQGEWEKTVVVTTSDHGDMDTQHKLIFKGPFMYEHMVRIPLMIRLPQAFGGKDPKRVKDADVVNVDLVPTIRELCGLKARETHGKSLVPLLTGVGTYEPRTFVIGQYYGKQRWVNPIRMIRTKQYKFNKYRHWQNELYDLTDDPNELNNLAADPRYADVVKELDAKLVAWMKEHGDNFEALNPTSLKGGNLEG